VAEASRARAPRALPIADPVGEIALARSDELAKRWAVALILDRPLEAMAEVPLGDLARDARPLCEAVLKAVCSNVELERLTGSADADASARTSPARRLAAICGARDARETAEAVEELRGVLWEALVAEIGPSSDRSSPGLALAACDRLAYVCAAMLAVGVDAAFGSQAAPPGQQIATAAPELDPIAPTSAPIGAPAVIVDELAGGRSASRVAAEAGRSGSLLESSPTEIEIPEIEIRDQRGEEGPAAWVGSIGAQLERFASDGLPFAVLLVELAEIEHLRHVEPAHELSRLAGQVEGALTAAVAGGGVVLVRERPGRCWLLATDTDRIGARHLAEHLAASVASGVSYRGAPLEVAVGTAVCPEDGREPATLAAYADVGLYAARAAIRASSATRPGAPVDESAQP
jgi:hypothetical protein